MNLGFNESNLSAAVSVVMKAAAELGQTDMAFGETVVTNFDLTDPAAVRAYMEAKTKATFEKALASPAGVPVGQIMGLIYEPVGFVFEECMGNANPPAVGSDGECDVAYEVNFWANL
ncbi:hypothetical protein [Pandoraea sp. ISTKB]|uniref:hypothetical protein n=1 Tax=Pandoraea sp. ISTKB TaxID=1586708 RepID=UPI000846CC56|nr:hypothetical protein [Pandoraea sp. ISTKB]ODP35010.1 hypothetical protein A9762_11635 [Pandoraea sp. ISTKB]